MILYYVRHGDPIYDPNQLTPLGRRQAEAVAKRLAVYGVDKIYSSPSKRARETAQPLCEILKMEPQILDWSDEDLVYRDMVLKKENGDITWACGHPTGRVQFSSHEVLSLGREWYTHPCFADTNFGPGINRIQQAGDAFLLSLGYRHDLENNCFYAERDNDQRIALFAHGGVGAALLSCILDIPYPLFSTRFDMTHSSVTVIEFREEHGIVIPCVLTYANDSHLYREGLPTKHQNRICY